MIKDVLNIKEQRKLKKILAAADVLPLCNYLQLNPHLTERCILEKKYTQFSIRKKSGGKRIIDMPSGPIMYVQRILAQFLSDVYNLIITESAYGFIGKRGVKEKRTIISNAAKHVGREYLYNIDITDFFPSINAAMVKNALIGSPLSVHDEVASFITLLSTYKWRLPVGSPTSPVLSNFVMYASDLKIEEWAKSNQAVYTRYADDLSFSKNTPFTDKVKLEIAGLIEEAGFSINQRKKRLQSQHQAQWVTGVKVNEKLNVDRRRIKLVRAMLFDWEKNGLESAMRRFSTKESISKNSNSFIENLRGNISFIAEVRGEDDSIVVRKYKQIFKSLIERDCYKEDICPF